MDTHNHIVPEFTLVNASAAVLVAFSFIAIMSLVKEPNRQKINAIILAGAAGMYWRGGLGAWEFVFGAILLAVAFKGLKRYYFIGVGWLLHAGWDVIHHFYGNPIIYLDPSSSAGCAVCDPILAVWFLLGAPSVWNLIRKQKTVTT
jgi:hypothetical protein